MIPSSNRTRMGRTADFRKLTTDKKSSRIRRSNTSGVKLSNTDAFDIYIPSNDVSKSSKSKAELLTRSRIEQNMALIGERDTEESIDEAEKLDTDI